MQLHADLVELSFFIVVLTAFIYALAVRRSACLDDADRPGNGEFEILSRSAVERTTTMVVALGFFAVGGVVSLFMPPPDDYVVLNRQAIVFRLCIMAGTIVLTIKLRREQTNRRRYNMYVSRHDRRSGDKRKPERRKPHGA